MSGNDDRHGGDDGFDDDIHFSDEELEAALDGFEKEFRDSNAAAGEPANDVAADSPADDAGAADSGQTQEADTATAFDDELQGLLGNKAKAAVLITRIASARLLAAFCQLSDVSADCIGSEEGAVAILRNLDGDGPEVAARDLGMGTTYLDPSGSQIGKKESIADTARVLSGIYDGIEYRGFGQSIVEELAQYATVPVWNGLTNEFHPTQILADFLTIKEQFGHLKGINFVYMGDARYNMGNSLMVGCAKMGMNFTACAPKKYFPDKALIDTCMEIAAQTGAEIKFCESPDEAVKNADVIYTDVWVSMGEPVEVWAERIHDLAPYQINNALMALAGPQAVFMHCLPAYHDHKTTVGKEMGEKFGRDAMEVTDEVFEGPQSIVFDEAENRMHTIKAVMAATLGYEG